MEHPTPSSERSRDLREWHRDFENRKIAGVCAGLAAQLGASVTAVRAGFVLLALLPPFHGLGVWSYLVLWFLMPAAPDAPSGLDRVLALVHSFLGDAAPRRDAWGPDAPRDPEPR